MKGLVVVCRLELSLLSLFCSFSYCNRVSCLSILLLPRACTFSTLIRGGNTLVFAGPGCDEYLFFILVFFRVPSWLPLFFSLPIVSLIVLTDMLTDMGYGMCSRLSHALVFCAPKILPFLKRAPFKTLHEGYLSHSGLAHKRAFDVLVFPRFTWIWTFFLESQILSSRFFHRHLLFSLLISLGCYILLFLLAFTIHNSLFLSLSCWRQGFPRSIVQAWHPRPCLPGVSFGYISPLSSQCARFLLFSQALTLISRGRRTVQRLWTAVFHTHSDFFDLSDVGKG